jgi:hypothetical protein
MSCQRQNAKWKMQKSNCKMGRSEPMTAAPRLSVNKKPLTPGSARGVSDKVEIAFEDFERARSNSSGQQARWFLHSDLLWLLRVRRSRAWTRRSGRGGQAVSPYQADRSPGHAIFPSAARICLTGQGRRAYPRLSSTVPPCLHHPTKVRSRAKSEQIYRSYAAGASAVRPCRCCKYS